MYVGDQLGDQNFILDYRNIRIGASPKDSNRDRIRSGGPSFLIVGRSIPMNY